MVVSGSTEADPLSLRTLSQRLITQLVRLHRPMDSSERSIRVRPDFITPARGSPFSRHTENHGRLNLTPISRNTTFGLSQNSTNDDGRNQETQHTKNTQGNDIGSSLDPPSPRIVRTLRPIFRRVFQSDFLNFFRKNNEGTTGRNQRSKD